jgi:hypothetical protein
MIQSDQKDSQHQESKMKSARMMSSLSPTPMNNSVSSAFLAISFDIFCIILTSPFLTETASANYLVIRKDYALDRASQPAFEGPGSVHQ